jgi:transcriptional regulator with XRE-family HTH domain
MADKRKGSVSDPCASLGRAIRRRREDVGLSQEELGHLSRLHRTYVGSVERGERNLTLNSLIAISRALQLAPHQLLQRAEL